MAQRKTTRFAPAFARGTYYAPDDQDPGDGSPDTPGNADETDGSENTGKTFTQAEVDELIKKRLDRERKRQEKKLDGIDLEAAKAALEAQEKAEEQSMLEQKQFKELLEKKEAQYQTELAKAKAELDALRTERTHALIDRQLITAAQSAVKPEQVATLLRGDLTIIDDQVVVRASEGDGPRLNDKGDPMSVKEYVETWLGENPHYQRAAPGTGASNPGTTSGQQPSGAFDPTDLSFENINKNLKKFAQIADQQQQYKG